MQSFLDAHPAKVTGHLSTYDRVIFKGHLTQLYSPRVFTRFLWNQGVRLKDFREYAPKLSDQIKQHAQEFAKAHHRRYEYLDAPKTKATGQTKEEYARGIAQEDGITEGLVCVLAALEPCTTITVRGNRETHRLDVVRRRTKCLHFYYYFNDPEFGFMHIRLQAWFPFTIQVYVNGREWLAKQLDKAGVAYERHRNCFTRIDDVDRARKLCDKFAHIKWPKVLDVMARRINPILRPIQKADLNGYYWCTDQAEYATDVMFKDRQSVDDVFPDLVELAMTTFDAKDILRFLGRKLHGNFQGDVTTDLKGRLEGRRVKHRMRGNSIKVYDKATVIRVETTITNPTEFKVRQNTSDSVRWSTMRKGVANFWRIADVALQANHRYLNALAEAQPKGEVQRELEDLCRSKVNQGRRVSKYNPTSRQDRRVFQGVMKGEHAITGFRNKDLRAHLFDKTAASSQEALRRSRFVTRLIAKLRGHALILKVHASRLYRLTEKGLRLMGAMIRWPREIATITQAPS
ncbi:MAG: hypothetical protein ACREA0_06955 [bacterium]